MKRALEMLSRPRHFPWIVLVLAVLVIAPRLGSYGFWEPREIAVADAARKWLERGERPAPAAEAAEQPVERTLDRPAGSSPASVSPEPGMAPEPGFAPEPGAAAAPEAAARKPKKSSAPRAPQEPRFTERLVAYGVERAGFSELGARWPLALLGLIAVMAAYGLGARMAGPRAGLLGAVVLLTTPYLVLESRQLTSDIGALAGSTLIVLGLAGLALASRWRALLGERSILPGALIACDLAALAAGVVLAREAAGDLLGLVPPLAGFGLGALGWALLDRRRAARGPVLAVGALALVFAVAALAGFLHEHFTWAEAQGGDRHLFGWTLDPEPHRIAELGAPWKDAGDVQIPFSAGFEQIAFGLFPWVALAPLALVGLALGFGRDEREEAGEATLLPPGLAGAVLFAWAGLALIVTAIAIRKVTPVLYPAVAAVAVAVGVWLDALLARRDRGGDRDGASLPLVALFVLLAAVVIGKDIAAAPEELTSLTAAGQAVKYPDGARLHLGVFLFGALFGLCAAAGLFLWRGPYRLAIRGRDLFEPIGRFGLHAAVASAVLFALFLAQVWIPGLSARMSSRDVLARYREIRQEGDQLGILGNLGSGPTYYAGGEYRKLNNRTDLIGFLREPGRVFALIRASEMCALEKEQGKRALAREKPRTDGTPPRASEQPFEFFVVDDDNVQFRLVSNKLLAGEEDLNPLDDVVHRAPPPGARPQPLAAWEEQLELVGVELPQRVERGASFQATFIYRIAKPVSRPWKVFVHIDHRAPPRIIGDHPFAGGHCPPSTFQVGDYIVDRFEVKVAASSNRGVHAVWTGFFVGSAGNYTNMKVTTGEPDDNNRVKIGEIEVR